MLAAQGPVGTRGGVEWMRGPCACPLAAQGPVGTRGGVVWMRGPCAQYISLKGLPREAQRREDQAGRQNRETEHRDQRAQVEAAGASWVCTCCRPA